MEIIYVFLLFVLTSITTCEEITIFSAKNIISFAKIMDYKVHLSSDSYDEITKYTYSKAFISVIVNVTLSKECTQNNNVRHFYLHNSFIQLINTITKSRFVICL